MSRIHHNDIKSPISVSDSQFISFYVVENYKSHSTIKNRKEKEGITRKDESVECKR